MKRPQRQVSGTAEYLGGTKFRFTCREGHTHVKDMGDRRLQKHKRMTETACKMFADYWANRVSFPCRKCGGEVGEMKKAIIEAEQKAGYWLALGREAEERGEAEKAERHYTRSEKWLSKLNRLEGKA